MSAQPATRASVDFSLVIPVYRNLESLPELLQQVAGLARDLPGTLELVLVVDASPDASHAYLSAALPQQAYPSQLLLLARNFGSFAAIREGLKCARGHYHAVMAADLQEPISLMHAFFTRLRSEALDVVVGSRESRADPWRQRWPAQLFWSLYRRLINRDIPPGGVDVFGCTAHFSRQLTALPEAHSSLIGLLFWLGHRRAVVHYTRLPRPHGKSAWSLGRKINYLLDSLFAFSDLPIKLLMLVGMGGMILAAGLGLVVLLAKLGGQVPVPGYAALMIALTFFAGLNCLGLGLIGSYAWRAYENSKQRPLALVLQQQDFNSSARTTSPA